MKLTYWILIGVVFVIIIFFLAKYFKNKSSQNNNVGQSIQTSNSQPVLLPGQTSNVAQIINSLFPYFATGVSSIPHHGSSGNNRGDTGSADLPNRV